MKEISKTVFVKKFVYKLYYRLLKNKDNAYISIKSEKYENKKMINSEVSTVKLPFNNEKKELEFLEEISKNIVFPCSLSYILEDMN